jgi:hypothetical protein
VSPDYDLGKARGKVEVKLKFNRVQVWTISAIACSSFGFSLAAFAMGWVALNAR